MLPVIKWGIIAILIAFLHLSSNGQDACSTNANPSKADILAFSSRSATGRPPNSCSGLSTAGTCSMLDIPEAKTLGLLVCSCVPGRDPRFQKATQSFVKRYSLYCMPVIAYGGSVTIESRDLKLLTSKLDDRADVLGELSDTQFALSPADRGSPYRIFVRRRDGKVPTTGDVKILSTLLKVEVEPEKIIITRKDSGIEQ